MGIPSEMNGYRLSTKDVDVRAVHAFLTSCYWAEAIPFDTVKRAVENSVCFSIFKDDAQVAFTRVISDRATFAYVCDVYVLETHRKQGLSKWMVEAMMAHPELQGLKRWVLVTKDAHTLYTRAGFKALASPEMYMEVNRMGLYKNPELFR